MNTVKILHCADIHIGAAESFLGNAAQNRRLETLLTFERIIDLCIEKEVQVLAIAGDLFDSNSVESSLAEAVLSKIAKADKLKVIFAAGNHDPLNPQSPFLRYKLPENLYVLGVNEAVLTFPELNLRVYGRSFETAFLEGKIAPSIIPEDDGFINLLVQHGELKSDLDSRYNAITKEFIGSSKMDYMALGHVHKRTEIGKIGDTYFAYCGCPEGQGFDELDEKGVFIGEIGKGICNMEFVPTAKRRHIHEKIDVSAIATEEITNFILKTLQENYGENYNENLYKIELVGSLDAEDGLNMADITARLSERVYYVKLKNSTQPTIDLEALACEQSLKGIFVKKMLEKMQDADETALKKYRYALELGLKAFSSEVKFDEN